MQQFLTRPVSGRFLPLTRLRTFLTSIQQARAISAEFATLNALSDIELRRMGLTRGVLRRHVRQKHTARVMPASTGRPYERSTAGHDA